MARISSLTNHRPAAGEIFPNTLSDPSVSTIFTLLASCGGAGLGLSRQIRVRIRYNKLSWQSVRTSRIWIQIQSLCTPCEGVIIGTETCSHQRSPRSQERTVLLPLPRPQQRLRGCRLPRLRWPGSLRSRRLLHTQQRRRGLLGFL